MATLQIEFKDGKFISHNGVNVEEATSTHIKGNGWIGNVDEEGNLYFIAIWKRKKARHQLKYTITNGYVKKVLRIGNEKSIVLKSYRMEKWPIDGIIGLSAGDIDKRITYFRSSDFQNFLDEHGITAVRYESANGIYKLIHESTTNFHEYIDTDGTAQTISQETKETETNQKVEVTDASWVIKKVYNSGVLTHCILYTLDDPKQIIGLPKVK